MKKTRILLTLLAVALASGLLFVSCPTEDKKEEDGLDGTWVYVEEGSRGDSSYKYVVTYTFSNGNFEEELVSTSTEIVEGTPTTSSFTSKGKGTYITSGSLLTMTTTQVSDGSTWYTKAEAIAKYGENNVASTFEPQKMPFAVSGKTLYLRSTAFTKQ